MSNRRIRTAGESSTGVVYSFFYTAGRIFAHIESFRVMEEYLENRSCFGY